jgi:hypothetical protein
MRSFSPVLYDVYLENDKTEVLDGLERDSDWWYRLVSAVDTEIGSLRK